MLQICKDDPDINQNIRDNYILPAYCSIEILDSVMNDINDYVSLDQDVKDFQLSIQKVDLKQLLQFISLLFAPQSLLKKVPIEINFSSKGQFIINQDSQRIKQVLINIISNAMRITQKGQIDINIIDEEGYISINVLDCGHQLDTRLQESIQYDFFNLNKKKKKNSSTEENNINNQQKRGLQLGLIISNSIVKVLSKGQELIIETSMVHGNTFSFKLYKFKDSDIIENLQNQENDIMQQKYVQQWVQTYSPTNVGETDRTKLEQLSTQSARKMQFLQNKSFTQGGNLNIRSKTTSNMNQDCTKDMSSSNGSQIKIQLNNIKFEGLEKNTILKQIYTEPDIFHNNFSRTVSGLDDLKTGRLEDLKSGRINQQDQVIEIQENQKQKRLDIFQKKNQFLTLKSNVQTEEFLQNFEKVQSVQKNQFPHKNIKLLDKDYNLNEQSLKLLAQQFNFKYQGSVQNNNLQQSLMCQSFQFDLDKSKSLNVSMDIKIKDSNQSINQLDIPNNINSYKNIQIPQIQNSNSLHAQNSLTNDTNLLKFNQDMINLYYQQIEQCKNCTKILLVDDEVFNMMGLSMNLNKNFKLSSNQAKSGEEAIELVQQKLQDKCCKLYQLIIMDVDMPGGKDGYQTSQEIFMMLKDLNFHQRTQIAIHTAYKDKNARNFDIQNSLIRSNLSKPCSLKQLGELLENSIKNYINPKK